jgi:20S proteasome subunit alpha 6
MSLSFGSVGKKDENRRTLMEFKIVGLEICDLGWTWGALPSLPVKIEAKDEDEDVPEVSQVVIKHEAMEEDGSLKPAAPVDKGTVKHVADTDASGTVELMTTTAESKPASHKNSSAACP